MASVTTDLPGPVPKAALDFFGAKGLRPSFSYKDVWAEEHTNAFTVAKIAETDILAQVQQSLLTALEAGVPFKQWAGGIKEQFDRSGWSDYQGTAKQRQARLRVIYQTNLRTARAVGQWERVQETKNVTPYFQYNLGASVNHRPEHEEIAGTLLPVDDQFWDTAFPPNGYGCQCYLQTLTQWAADKLGGVTRRPELPLVEWSGPNNQKVLAPRGIHPSFAYNPGKESLRVRQVGRLVDEAGARLRVIEHSELGDKNVASMFRRLLREGGRTDAEIFALVQQKFKLDEKKRSYVNWYRRELIKAGEMLPGEAPPVVG